MKVSKSELEYFLKQAFEAKEWVQGQYEFLAQALVWSEMCGLEVIKNLHFWMSSPADSNSDCRPLEPESNSIGEHLFADHRSLAFAHPRLLSFVKERSSLKESTGEALKLKIQIPDPILLPFTFRWLNVETELYWTRCSQNYLCRINPESHVPETLHLWSNHSSEEFARNQIIAQNAAYAYIGNNAENLHLDVKHKSIDCAHSYFQCLKNGIEIDESNWQVILQLGEGVLVEATEQSRQGAGA